MSTLHDQLGRLATAPVLLVASDYDGTLAPIVSDPAAAHPHPEAMVALRLLAELPHTHVTVISGRALRDLRRLAAFPDEVHLVGSHGSEFDLDFGKTLTAESTRRHEQITQLLREVVKDHPGLSLEVKPASVALHYRNVPAEAAKGVLEAITERTATIPGVHTRHGKCVVELSISQTNKGDALDIIRHRVGASAVIFIGDDITDEDAFRTLTGPDIGIKVGEGSTAAPHRVDDTAAVAHLLAQLAEARATWLAGSGVVPIESHVLLSDQRALALLTPDARLVWYCAPRLDSPALFAELLGGPPGGRFAIAPAEGEEPPVQQRYRDATMVVETTWPTCRVVDFLDTSDGRTTQRAGRSDLVRIVHGTGQVAIEFAPRLDFGRALTHLAVKEDGLQVLGTQDPVVLRAPGVVWTIADEAGHHVARAVVDLDPAEPLVMELRVGTSQLTEDRTPAAERQAATEMFWQRWAEPLALPALATESVRRSALVLKALCYGPTGAVAAAATTSLPEHLGGVRNWDYRYCWLRDAAMAVGALTDLGSHHEAIDYLNWVLELLDELDQAPERLRPLYSVLGRELGAEGEIAELAGYGGSRPVRVGNAASGQVQLDVFGPIVEVVAKLVQQQAPLTHEHWRLVRAMVQAVTRRWREPDHGIWEIRKSVRHHVHTKVMCWVTVDRAIKVGDQLHNEVPPEWLVLRDAIAEDILAHGWNERVGAFTAAYGAADLDAAALVVGLSGLVSPEDVRFRSTVQAVERELREGPTVYRYHEDDGLPGIEGGFHLCASWLVESYLLTGHGEKARELFEAMLACGGAQGLFSEQFDPRSNRSLGNHPQAYSHIGIIANALRLHNRSTADTPPVSTSAVATPIVRRS